LPSADYQRYDQAKRDFINATMRRESGAQIKKDEFENANKQYFPMPGDDPETLKQKKANRMEAIKGIAAGAGPSYKFPLKVGESGNLVPNVPGPKAGLDVQGSLENARKAIKEGKNPDAIKAKLRANGIDPAGL